MRNLLLVIACIALLPSALAFSEADVDVQDNVYLVWDMTVPITVENNSLSDKGLEVDFIGPSALFYEFSNVPSEIKASQSSEISLYLSPSIEMEGTTYNSMLIVKLGDETVLKELKLHVSKIMPEPTPTETPSGGEEEPEEGILPFAFLGSMEGIAIFILALIVVILALIFIAKLWSLKKERRGEYFE